MRKSLESKISVLESSFKEDDLTRRVEDIFFADIDLESLKKYKEGIKKKEEELDKELNTGWISFLKKIDESRLSDYVSVQENGRYYLLDLKEKKGILDFAGELKDKLKMKEQKQYFFDKYSNKIDTTFDTEHRNFINTFKKSDYPDALFEECPYLEKNLKGEVPVTRAELDSLIACEISLEYLDVSEITSFDRLFKNHEINNLDLSRWNTSNVRYLDRMLEGAKIKGLNISSWDVSNVSIMSRFARNAEINGVDLSNWDLHSIREVYNAFQGAKSDESLGLEEIKMGSFIVDIDRMFLNSEISFDISKWDLSSIESAVKTFENAEVFGDVSSISNKVLKDSKNKKIKHLTKENINKDCLINFHMKEMSGDQTKVLFKKNTVNVKTTCYEINQEEAYLMELNFKDRMDLSDHVGKEGFVVRIEQVDGSYKIPISMGEDVVYFYDKKENKAMLISNESEELFVLEEMGFIKEVDYEEKKQEYLENLKTLKKEKPRAKRKNKM